MENDERPTKRQRLHDISQPHAQNNALENSHTNGNRTEVVLEKTETIQDVTQDDLGEGLSGSPPGGVIIAPLPATLEPGADGQPLSKNQLKKLRKKQEWESKRDERRTIRKQKDKEKKQRKRERLQEAAENGDSPSQPLERPSFQKATQLPITFLIDCDFDDLMLDNERISLAGQITRCYSDNRKAPFRAHLSVCSFGGKLRKRFDEVLTHHKGWKDVRFLDCDFIEASERASHWMKSEKGGTLAGIFSSFAADAAENETQLQDKGEIVYLTSESNHTLTELKPYSTYIIGGLVDKNREKGICYKRATKRGIKTAKLAIGEFMEMQSRKVLATNHVNEVMLRWLECGDWGESFLKVIPKRKGGKPKGDTEEGGNEEAKESGVARQDSDPESHDNDEAGDDVDEDVHQSS